MEHAAVAKPQVTQLRVPQPHSDSLAQAIWAPRPSNVPQAAALGPDDIARQIRAKFENLVRASPLPKVSSTDLLRKIFNIPHFHAFDSLLGAGSTSFSPLGSQFP